MIVPNVKQLIQEKYLIASKNEDLIFNDVETFIENDPITGMSYWIRFAPSLLVKPERGDTPINFDPLGKHEPELLILESLNDQDNEFKLVLNKFPVMPNHTLLITNEWIHQKTNLTPYDLLTSYQLILQMNQNNNNKDNKERHLIIYNSGSKSGSSQNHKHLQLLKFPNNFTPFQDNLCKNKDHFIPSDINSPLIDPLVSFAHFVIPLPKDKNLITQSLLNDCYLSLLQYINKFFPNDNNLQDQRSYNVILTENWLCLVPRSNIRATNLPVGFNSIGYTGLIMIKQLETLNTIKTDPHLIDNLLLQCGFPNNTHYK